MEPAWPISSDQDPRSANHLTIMQIRSLFLTSSISWKCRSGGCCLGLLYRQQPQRFHEGAPWQRNQTQSIWGKLTSSKLAKFPESQWKQDRAIHIPCNKTDFFKVTCRQGDCINQWGQCIIQPSPWTESNITPCNHEGADSRIFVHAADCAKQGISKILVSSVDSDVVVLAVRCPSELDVQIWVAYGKGKSLTYIAAHDITNSIGPQKSLAIPFFHAITGCDTTSAFYFKSKSSAWKAWN